MSITSISRDQPNNVSIVRITSTDTLATIASHNYIANQTAIINQLNNGIWHWFSSDILLIDSFDGNAFFEFTDDTFSSLVLLNSVTGGTVSPGLANQVAIYPVTSNTISGTFSLPPQVQVSIGSLNNGTGATSSTFWKGDGTWGPISSSSFSYTQITGTSQAAAVNQGYIPNNAGLVTITLPAIASIGDIIATQGKGPGGWSLVANTGQSIVVGSMTTSDGGSASSTNRSDAIEVVCTTANTVWSTKSMIGNLTIL